MEPKPALDKFQSREIEQQLAADLQAASEQLLRAPTEEERLKAVGARVRALQRFTDFVAKGIVPGDLLAHDTLRNGSSKD